MLPVYKFWLFHWFINHIHKNAHVQLHVMICFVIVIKTETSTLLTNAIIRSWHLNQSMPDCSNSSYSNTVQTVLLHVFIMKNKNNESCSIEICKCFIKRSDVIPRWLSWYIHVHLQCSTCMYKILHVITLYMYNVYMSLSQCTTRQLTTCRCQSNWSCCRPAVVLLIIFTQSKL